MLQAKKQIFNGEPIWKCYEVEVNGILFIIDGQNGAEDGSNEWQLIRDNSSVDIFPSKKSALEWLNENQNNV